MGESLEGHAFVNRRVDLSNGARVFSPYIKDLGGKAEYTQTESYEVTSPRQLVDINQDGILLGGAKMLEVVPNFTT